VMTSHAVAGCLPWKVQLAATSRRQTAVSDRRSRPRPR
jgi:hypothetical protein